MPIQTHHSCWQAFVFILRESNILEGPDQYLASLLFGEIIAAERNCKEILVPGIPDNGSDMFFLFLIAETPDRQQFSLGSLSFLSLLPIVLIVIILLIFLVLTDHPLHDLHAPLE